MDADSTCVICRDDDASGWKCDRCRKVAHKECMDAWIKHRAVCPHCALEVYDYRLIALQTGVMVVFTLPLAEQLITIWNTQSPTLALRTLCTFLLTVLFCKNFVAIWNMSVPVLAMVVLLPLRIAWILLQCMVHIVR